MPECLFYLSFWVLILTSWNSIFIFWIYLSFKPTDFRIPDPYSMKKQWRVHMGQSISRIDQVEFLADSLYKNFEVIWSAEAMKF